MKRELTISRQIQYSDGCACQYKSTIPFCDVSYAEEDFGFPVEKYYYGSRHGKGPSDGEGAVIKNAARRAVRGQQRVINSAKDLYNFAVETIHEQKSEQQHTHSKRSVFWVEEGEILRNLPDRAVVTVKGTRNFHCVRTKEHLQIEVRHQSCFCSYCRSHDDADGECMNNQYW